MIRLTHRATCSCGWSISCDVEAQAEVEGEAHLNGVAERAHESVMRIVGVNPATYHRVIVEKVRTWEEGDAEHLG